MGILSWILMGALAGWLASKITGNDASMGWIANIIVGIIGAVIGGVAILSTHKNRRIHKGFSDRPHKSCGRTDDQIKKKGFRFNRPFSDFSDDPRDEALRARVRQVRGGAPLPQVGCIDI